MYPIESRWSPSNGDAAQSLLLNPSEFAAGRERLRIYIVGSPAAAQDAIDRLHLLKYADRDAWSRVVQMPEGGAIIHPDPNDILRYLERWRSR